ncbi:MAG: bifunctional DNA primase/polymerase [Chloroflexi bacterium]|nr:bifunctional DNA primase/polymerase [Chloroflexota bacterium]
MPANTKTPSEWARDYVARGWSPIPVPLKTKKAIVDGWQNLRLTQTDIPDHFNGEAQNIGVLLGEPSGGLIDIDLDAPEAVQLAPYFLENTRCLFGRQGKPLSHWIYVASPCGSTSQYRDTDGSMLVEYRSTGAQTVFPGSTHESGELIEWAGQGEPLNLDGPTLKAQVSRLAAAALIARHWPATGGRNDAALALAGGLLRGGWSLEEVENFIHAVGIGAGDEETADREKAAKHTRQKIENDDPATGWPALADLVGEKAVEKVLQWLGIRHKNAGKLDGEGSEKRTSQATDLVGLAEDVVLWHSPDSDAFATISVDEHRENIPLNSRAFKRWLARKFYLEQGKAAGSQAVQDALSVLGGKAVYEGSEHQVFTRLASYDGKIYLDLANQNWEVVEIDAAGWRIMSDPPVRFRRTKGMLPIPNPVAGGGIGSLRRFVNVSDADWPLVLAWVVAALRNIGPYPVMVLNGEHGSAKSTTARVLRRLVDPNKADLRSEPKEPRDLMIAATNCMVVAFDNLSRVSDWLSDALCRLATGGGFSTRTLYENDEEMIFEAQRPVILNGINEIITKPDLLDRAITITCPVIPDDERRTEIKFWREFEAARAAILGSLLNAASHALAHVDEIALDRLPRMADFAEWAVAAEPALELDSGAFMNAYTGNREMANELVLEASPVVASLIEFLKIQAWEGPTTELLVKLDSQVTEKTRLLKSWPKNGRGLSATLRGLAPNLRATGIEIDFIQSSGSRSKRLVRIRTRLDFCDASDASDASGTKPPIDFASQVESVASHAMTICDAPHAPASQSVASVANIPTHSKTSSKVWQEPL